MATATLNLRVQHSRLMTKAEAAHYFGIAVKRFEAMCPVRPVRLADRIERYDVQDLDLWIENLKGGTADDADTIVARLG
jgi:hypothetical protein